MNDIIEIFEKCLSYLVRNGVNVGYKIELYDFSQYYNQHVVVKGHKWNELIRM